MTKVIVIEMAEDADLDRYLGALRKLLPAGVTVYAAIREDAERVMAVFQPAEPSPSRVTNVLKQDT